MEERKGKELDEAQQEGPPELPEAPSLLSDLLEKARNETEAETRRLLQGIKAKEENERRMREEEIRRKAEEARRKVEEERRRREEQLRRYAQKKAQEQAVQEGRTEQSVPAQPPAPKSRMAMVVSVAAFGVVVIAGVVYWFSVPHGEPVVFPSNIELKLASDGSVTARPFAYGPRAVQAPRPIPPERVVAAFKPKTCKPPRPEPAAVPARHHKKSVKRRPGRPTIRIRTGIFGGNKLVK